MGRNNGVVELSDRAEASRDESEWVEPLDVLDVLGHRYPFLLVDRLRVVEPGRRALGLKRVTAGDWWSEAADSGLWEMPGMLVVEALAQTSAAVLISLVNESPGAVGYFASADRVRFRSLPRLGDTLTLAVELVWYRRGVARLRGAASVDGRLAVSADFTTVIRGRAA